MAERYTRLFALTENLYQSASPVMIAAGALLKDTQTGRVLAQIKLQSLSDKPIKAAKVDIMPLDVVGNELGEAVEHQYLDLNIHRDEAFGAKSPIALPNATTRAFRAVVTSVVFADNSVWQASSDAWEPLPKPIELETEYSDAELCKQFRVEFSKDSRYVYDEFFDLCRCLCGALNRQEETVCHACGCDLLAVRDLDIAELEARKNERVQQECAEHRQMRALAKARKARKRKITAIAILLLLVVAAFLIDLKVTIIPNGKYKDAVALMNIGEYEQAISVFEALEGYKDSTVKIMECQQAMLESAYHNASELAENGKYMEAYNAFLALNMYKDSPEQAASLYCKGRIQEIARAGIGSYVRFGFYEQDGNESNGEEEIEWRVLDIQDGGVLLISRYALDCKPYNDEKSDVTWETCTLRQWLNYDFIYTAFSAEEREYIPTVLLTANTNPYYGTDSGNDTQDRVFVLSITEANKYFDFDSARCCKPTDYADINGVYVGERSGNCAWWLRSPCADQDGAACVITDGSIDYAGLLADAGDAAVRPAIWVIVE